MTLVFGTDLSTEGEAVAQLAARIAARAGTDLLLVHVSTDPRAGVVLGTAEASLLDGTRLQLDALAARLRAQGVTVETDLWAGPVADSVASAAESVVARLLVLAELAPRRGRLLGRVSERVARQARVPVLVVRDVRRLDDWIAGVRPLRLIVGTDGGEAAARALVFARDLAAYGPIEVVVASIADPVETSRRYGVALPTDPCALDPAAAAALRRDVDAQIVAAGMAGARVEIRAGTASPASHLAILAETEGADLVVVGVRKRSWIEEVWRGSVAQGVLRGTGTNVAAVPRTLAEERHTPVPPPRTLVVATDLSPAGDAAVPVGFGLVALGGTVHLVHVVDTERIPVAGQRVLASDVERRLRDRVPEGLGAHTEIHAVGGETAAAILALAERVGADAICIASLGRSALGAAVLGSVSRDVVAGAHCPVVVVPAPRE